MNIIKCILLLLVMVLDKRLHIVFQRNITDPVYPLGKVDGCLDTDGGNEYIIRIRYNSLIKMAEVLVHELVHVLQMVTGKVNPLNINGQLQPIHLSAWVHGMRYSEDDQYHEYWAQYVALYVTRIV